MENKISSRQEEEFRNQKHQFQNKKNTESKNTNIKTTKYQANNFEKQSVKVNTELNKEESNKRTSSKKQRADFLYALNKREINNLNTLFKNMFRNSVTYGYMSPSFKDCKDTLSLI